MPEAISILEVVVMDETHLELKDPLPQGVGKKIKIAILATSQNHEHALEKLKHAYLTSTKAEQAFEVKLAEEGLATAPGLEIENGEAEKWCE
ncbi:hypothetical protein KJ068_14000 [bacterium]|nr:hypothetical protein [bacterium]NUM74251.1 hypothetical protein [candidate division KSB1 bacterium]